MRSARTRTQTRRASRRVELTSIHRFNDPTWGELSLRLRDPKSPEDAAAVAEELFDTGHVTLVNSDETARATMVDGWFAAAGLIPEPPVRLTGELLTVVVWPARRAGVSEAADLSSEPLERSAVA